jgi:hypothetical protein
MLRLDEKLPDAGKGPMEKWNGLPAQEKNGAPDLICR